MSLHDHSPHQREARLVHLASLDGYVAIHRGRIVEIAGRMLCPSAETLRQELLAYGLTPSDRFIRTATS